MQLPFLLIILLISVSSRFVVIWESNQAIKGKIYDNTGDSPTLYKNEWQLSDVDCSCLGNQDIDMFDDGEFVIAYMANNVPDMSDIRRQCFDADGNPYISAPAQIIEEQIGLSFRPQISTLLTSPLREFVITWEVSGGGTNYDIYARRYYHVDDWWGWADDEDVLLVNSNDLIGNQQFASCTTMGDGSAVIYWTNGNIQTRIYFADGTDMIGAVPLNQITTGVQSHPEVTRLTDGWYILVWQSDHTTERSIWAQYLTPIGLMSGNNFAINDDDRDALSPRVAAMTGGRFAVVYEYLHFYGFYRVYLNIYNPDRTLRIRTVVDRNNFKMNYNPDVVAVNDQGRIIVVYVLRTVDGDPTSDRVYGSYFDYHGRRLGYPFQISFAESHGPRVGGYGWDGLPVPAPHCPQITDGGYINTITNGYCSDYLCDTATMIEVRCNTPVYTGTASPSSSLCINGVWSPAINFAGCYRGCGEMPIREGYVSTYDIPCTDTCVHDTVITFTCGTGYEGTPSVTTSTCDDGYFTTFIFDLNGCNPICYEFSPREGYEVSYEPVCSGNVCGDNTVATFVCAGGYQGIISPATTSLCLENEWGLDINTLTGCEKNCIEMGSRTGYTVSYVPSCISGQCISTTIATYDCASGYSGTITPSTTTSCLSTGLWNNDVTSLSGCYQTCDLMIGRTGYDVSYSPSCGGECNSGTVITFSCASGFSGTPSTTTSTCSTGSWSTHITALSGCNPISLTCVAMTPRQGYNINYSPSCSDPCNEFTVATFSCDTGSGYTGSPSTGTSTCISGEWGTDISVISGCIASCPTMATRTGYVISYSSGCPNSLCASGITASFSCDVGYEGTIIPSTASTCNDGSWSLLLSGVSGCEETCDIMNSRTGYEISYSPSCPTGVCSLNTIATFSCAAGYTGTPSSSGSSCIGGSWTVDVASLSGCAEPCDMFASKTGYITSYNLACPGGLCPSTTVATFTCDNGYSGSIIPSSTSNCVDGIWSTGIDTISGCLQSCSMLVDRIGYTVSYNNDCSSGICTSGTVGSFTCSSGYAGAPAPLSSTCTDGSWSVDFINVNGCLQTCNELIGRTGYSVSYSPGCSGVCSSSTTAIFSCNLGDGFTGTPSPGSSLCTGGDWSNSINDLTGCNPTMNDCPTMPSSDGYSVSYDQACSPNCPENTVATFSCDSGYYGNPSSLFSQCVAGVWNTPISSISGCNFPCSLLTPRAGYDIEYSPSCGATCIPSTVAILTCESGYSGTPDPLALICNNIVWNNDYSSVTGCSPSCNELAPRAMYSVDYNPPCSSGICETSTIGTVYCDSGFSGVPVPATTTCNSGIWSTISSSFDGCYSGFVDNVEDIDVVDFIIFIAIGVSSSIVVILAVLGFVIYKKLKIFNKKDVETWQSAKQVKAVSKFGGFSVDNSNSWGGPEPGSPVSSYGQAKSIVSRNTMNTVSSYNSYMTQNTVSSYNSKPRASSPPPSLISPFRNDGAARSLTRSSSPKNKKDLSKKAVVRCKSPGSIHGSIGPSPLRTISSTSTSSQSRSRRSPGSRSPPRRVPSSRPANGPPSPPPLPRHTSF